MPIYEYTCPDCGSNFELLVKAMADDNSSATCPGCGGTAAKRQFSSFAIGTGSFESPAQCSPGFCGNCPAEGTCPHGEN